MVAAFLPITAHAAGDSTATAQIRALYQSLITLSAAAPPRALAPSRLAHQDLSLTISSGRFFPVPLSLPSLDDLDSIAAVWIEAPLGIQCTPRLPMEQERLRHLIGQPELVRSPPCCLMIADARLIAELRPGGDPRPGGDIGASFTSTTTRKYSLSSLRRLLGKLEKQDPLLMEEAVRATVQSSQGRFLLLLWPEAENWEIYLFDPHEREEVALFRLHPGGTLEPLVRYSMYADTTYFLLSGVARPEARPVRYELTARLSAHQRMSVEGTVRLVNERAGLRLLRFRIDPRLTLEKINASGYPLSSLDNRRSPLGDQVFVVDPPLPYGDSITIDFRLVGRLVDDQGELDIGSAWYPQFGYGERADFAVTVIAPTGGTIIPSGIDVQHVPMDTSSRAVKKPREQAVSFVTPMPVPYLSFGYGAFESFIGRADSVPDSSAGNRVIVQVHEQLHERTTDPSFAAEPQEAADDLASSWRFFRERLGALPWPSLRVHDLFGWHGRSYPGLVQIGWHTFYPADPVGYNSQFRAHEVAHQWFGVAVGFESYHDLWLSEGIAEYLGLCYVQHRFGEKVFRGWLEEYRRGLLSVRDNEHHREEAPGAMALGYRTASASRSQDYDLVIYRKGAWVMHMLRELLTDPDGSDDRFWSMLRELFDRYRGRRATSRDLQFLAEKYSGADLDWFFNQWLYGNAIPSFQLSWTAEPEQNDGMSGYRLRLDITQADAGSAYKGWLPVRIEFADHTHHDYKLFVGSQSLHIQMPWTESKPVRVLLDPNVTILARF